MKRAVLALSMLLSLPGPGAFGGAWANWRRSAEPMRPRRRHGTTFVARSRTASTVRAGARLMARTVGRDSSPA
jgi:hypothetical protein